MKSQEYAEYPNNNNWNVVHTPQTIKEGDDRANNVDNAERDHKAVECCTPCLVGNCHYDKYIGNQFIRDPIVYMNL